MSDKLPTAAEVEETLMQKVARRSREKGSNYERTVAKKIAGHFGFKWEDAFFRTKPHGHAQPEGDIKPINDMQRLWKFAKLGPLECKSRKEWSFDQLFKNPEKSHLYGYWKKSNDDTKSTNSVVVFTKPGVTDYVLVQDDGTIHLNRKNTILRFNVEGVDLVVVTLTYFLNYSFPDPQVLI